LIDLESVGKSTTILFVQYTLVPYAAYPIQICESIEAVKYVLDDLGRLPSDVILGGDSAGANLCLAILSHIMHPSPDFPAFQIITPLKALVMISPWVIFDIKQDSGKRNADKDIFKVEMGTRWGNDYLAGKPTNPYAEALLPPAEWWKDAKVERVLVVAGADEVLVDPISL
jgi:acetyl esterase/lipase